MEIGLYDNVWIQSLILFGIEFQIGIYGWLPLRKIVFLILCACFLKDLFRQKGETKIIGEAVSGKRKWKPY